MIQPLGRKDAILPNFSLATEGFIEPLRPLFREAIVGRIEWTLVVVEQDLGFLNF